MKTTLDIPDAIFRQAKARSAIRGISLRQFVTEALEEKVAPPSKLASRANPLWMTGFGALADLKEETLQIERQIAQTFGSVEEDDRS